MGEIVGYMIKWNIVEYRLIPFSNQTCSAGKYSITGHVNNGTKRMDLEEYMVHGQSQVGYP